MIPPIPPMISSLYRARVSPCLWVRIQEKRGVGWRRNAVFRDGIQQRPMQIGTAPLHPATGAKYKWSTWPLLGEITGPIPPDVNGAPGGTGSMAPG